MNAILGNCLCATLCSLLVIGLAGLRQDPATVPRDDEPSRVEQLEQRVQILEQILFSTSQLDAREATRRLERARQQLRGTQELFQRGLIGDAQLEQDRFDVLIAERELELAMHPTRHRHLVCSLELLDAQRRVEMARLNLRHTTNMNNRGFSSLSQIEDAQKELTTAESAAATAQQKLDAATKMDAINQPESSAAGDRKEPPQSGKSPNPPDDK